MKRKLYPRVDEPMMYVGLKVHESIYLEIEAIKRGCAQTRSEAVRGLLIEALRARGVVASVAEMQALV